MGLEFVPLLVKPYSTVTVSSGRRAFDTADVNGKDVGRGSLHRPRHGKGSRISVLTVLNGLDAKLQV